MSFLNSIMLFGTAAVAVPIIIHLLNRRKFKKVSWAAMKFIKLSVEQNQRRMQLEDLILLLLRCALLALLAFALARPALKSSGTDILGQAKVTAVVVLDNSYSMDLRGLDKKSAFQKARAAAKEAIDAMPSGSYASVLLASDLVQEKDSIISPTRALRQAHEVIDRAKVSHHATDLYPAVDQAVKILKGRAALRKEIYIITDGQDSGWQQQEEIRKLIDENRDDIRVYILRVGESNPPANYAVTGVDVASGLTPVEHPLRFDVTVANHAAQAVTNMNVGLYLDDGKNPVDKVMIPEVKAGATRTVPLYARFSKVGYHSVRASFDQPERFDSLEADNQNFLVVRAVRDVRVLVVDGDTAARDPREHESYFLKLALEPVADHYVKVDTVTPTDFARNVLNRYAAVVLANVERLTPNQVSALKGFLRQGGGVLVYPGDRVDVKFYNDELFAKHGLLPSKWGEAIGDELQDEVFSLFQSAGFEHPITAPWNNQEFGQLDDVRTFRHLKLEKQPELSTEKEAGPVKVVLRYAAARDAEGSLGEPAIMERDWGAGRVFQFSTTADTAWSDFAVRASSVVPMLYRILGNVQAQGDKGLNLRVGESFLHPLAAHQPNQQGRVVVPGLAQTNRLSAEVLLDRPVLQFKETHRAGLYEFILNGDEQATLFAVQPDQRESDLHKVNDSALPTAATLIHWEADADLKKQVKKARVGAEYWLIVLLVVLAMVALETYLAQKFSQSK
ncbi:MAG: BatA domain-containing protein [Verrucomicrobia subdivision 3 bacterium]|nr:BatA domain-containing protein [Limisphaerales bacterium]